MDVLVVAFALLLASAGGVSLYLSSPHQRWRAAPLPARPARVAGALLLAAGLGAFSRALDVVAAVFTFVGWLMLLFVLLPYAGAAIVARRRG